MVYSKQRAYEGFVDECVNIRLLRYLPGYDFVHATGTPLRGLRNGALLQAVAPGYDVFITLDRNIQFQQNLSKFALVFVILRSASNALKDLLPPVPDTLVALDTIRDSQRNPGDVYEIKPRQS